MQKNMGEGHFSDPNPWKEIFFEPACYGLLWLVGVSCGSVEIAGVGFDDTQ